LLVNRREEPILVDVRVAAGDNPVLESSVVLAADAARHLSCEWPRKAWSYEVAVRPADSDQWHSVSVSEGGQICEKVAIEAAEQSDAVTFYRSAECPNRFRDHSCATSE